MAIRGSLKEASLADVCQLLALGQKTGRLSVTDRSKFGQIYFERGQITHATIVNRRDRLGDLLVHDGVITHEQLREVIERQSGEPDRRLGELLIEDGLLDSELLAQYIRLQVEEAVFSLFTWLQGSFYFEVDQFPDSGETRLSINPESLLLEAARRVDEWGLIEKKIPTLDLLFGVDPERIQSSGVELTQEQESIVPLLDGSHTVQELVDRTGLGEFETGKALYGLIQAGFAHRIGRREPEAHGRVRDAAIDEHRNLGIAFYQARILDDAIQEFRRVLELQPGDSVSRSYLALIAMRQDRHRDAVRLYKELLEETGPSFPAFVNMANALVQLGRLDDARLVLDEAEALRSSTPEVALARAMIDIEDGDLEAASGWLAAYRERIGEREVPSALFFHHAAGVAAALGQTEEARGRVQEGLEAHPASAPLLVLAGVMADREGDTETAEHHLRRALEEDVTLGQAHKNLGELAYRQKNFEEAMSHFERAARAAPKLGDDLYSKLGNLHYKQRERDKALEYWRRALELNPDNDVVRNNLEVVAHASG